MYTGLLVAIGGALGASLRYGVQKLVVSLGLAFPLGILAANLFGCLILGLLLPLISEDSLFRSFGVVGVLGAFTTMSAFSLDTWTFIESGRYAHALIYAAITVVGGLGALALGLWLVR